MKRILSMLLCLALVIGFIPAVARAEGELTATFTASSLGSADVNFTGTTIGGGDIQLSAAQASGTQPKYYVNGSAVRVYKKSTFTISPTTGVTIKSVAFTTVSSSYDVDSAVSLTNATLTSNNNISVTDGTKDVVLSPTDAQVRIVSLTVTYVKDTSGETPDPETCDHAETKLTWEKDDTQHWQECECGNYTTTPVDHDFTNSNTCVCGQVKPSVPDTPDIPVTGSAFVKVTEVPADWSGEYLIVYENGNVAFNGALSTLDAVSNTVNVTISNDEIAATDALKNAIFTIAKNGSNYTIKSASGYYIGQASNANGLASNQSTTYAHTISLNADGSVNLISGGAYLRYNFASNQLRFRYYKSSSYTGQKAIALYKYVEATAETPEVPAFDSAAPVLKNDLAMNFYVPKAMFENTGYTNPYAVFNFDGKDYTVNSNTEATIDGVAMLVFTFKNIAPHKAGMDITYTLKSTYNGEEVSSESGTYSILTYCKNKLAGTDTELKTLVSDLLNYCAAVQTSLGQTNLVTDGVTGMTPSTGDVELESCTAVTKDTVAEPVAAWDSLTLVLRDNVTIRMFFTAENIEGLSVKIGGEKNATITEIKQAGSLYYVDFTGLMANEMSAVITATVYNGETAVSETVTYSIESYAAKNKDVTKDNLGALVTAMMKYGNSAANYQ